MQKKIVSSTIGKKASVLWNKRLALIEALKRADSTKPTIYKTRIRKIKGTTNFVKVYKQGKYSIHRNPQVEFSLMTKFNHILSDGIKTGRFNPKSFEFEPVQYHFALKPGNQITENRKGVVVMEQAQGVNAAWLLTFLEHPGSFLPQTEKRKIEALCNKNPLLSTKQVRNIENELRRIAEAIAAEPKTVLEGKLLEQLKTKKAGWDIGLVNVIIKGINSKTNKPIVRLVDLFSQ